MAARRKLYEYTAENDIRYRGPLSYQGFQVVGWLCIVTSVYCLLLGILVRLNPETAESRKLVVDVLGYIASMSLPFLLIANFSRILSNAEGYRKQLLRNGGAALGIFIAAVFVFSRYVISLIRQYVTDPENVVPVLTNSFHVFRKSGFLAFNLFIDLFLCTLFMFFLTAKPKRVFTGKKIWIFRFFAVFPVAYEVCCIILKGKAAVMEITLPLWSFPLLTVKPPMTFMVFMILAFYIKTREWHFLRHGKTHGDYMAFMETNRNSLRFSIFLSVTMVIAAVIDFAILLVMTTLRAESLEALKAADVQKITEYASVAEAVGFGAASVPLFLAAPFVLLFSYTRFPKNRRISIFIPLAAIALILVLLVEGIYQGLSTVAPQINNRITIQELFSQMTAGYTNPAGSV